MTLRVQFTDMSSSSPSFSQSQRTAGNHSSTTCDSFNDTSGETVTALLENSERERGEEALSHQICLCVCVDSSVSLRVCVSCKLQAIKWKSRILKVLGK